MVYEQYTSSDAYSSRYSGNTVIQWYSGKCSVSDVDTFMMMMPYTWWCKSYDEDACYYLDDDCLLTL